MVQIKLSVAFILAAAAIAPAIALPTAVVPPTQMNIRVHGNQAASSAKVEVTNKAAVRVENIASSSNAGVKVENIASSSKASVKVKNIASSSKAGAKVASSSKAGVEVENIASSSKAGASSSQLDLSGSEIQRGGKHLSASDVNMENHQRKKHIRRPLFNHRHEHRYDAHWHGDGEHLKYRHEAHRDSSSQAERSHRDRTEDHVQEYDSEKFYDSVSDSEDHTHHPDAGLGMRLSAREDDDIFERLHRQRKPEAPVTVVKVIGRDGQPIYPSLNSKKGFHWQDYEHI